MQGKILADGLISGNDGNRYTYTASDLKNAQSKSINAIIGSEVDFEGKDGKASEIYITKQTFDLQHRLFDGDLQSVKFKVYAATGCYLLTWIPFVGVVAALLAIVLQFLVIMSVNKGSQSTTLLKNYIIALLIPFVGGIIIVVSIWMGIGGNAWSLYSGGGNISTANYIFSALGVSGIIFGILVALSWWFFIDGCEWYMSMIEQSGNKEWIAALIPPVREKNCELKKDGVYCAKLGVDYQKKVAMTQKPCKCGIRLVNLTNH